MIDSQLIESAKFIRRDYLSQSNKLTKYYEDVKELGYFLLKKVDELKKFNDDSVKKIKNNDDLSKVTNHILKEIGEIEIEERKIRDKVDKINLDLKKLKKDEENLYLEIKERHPKLTDDEIVKEIHKHLDE